MDRHGKEPMCRDRARLISGFLGLFERHVLSRLFRRELFHTVGEQRDGCMISAVFEPKMEIPV
jgi:hypothetical protein